MGDLLQAGLMRGGENRESLLLLYFYQSLCDYYPNYTCFCINYAKDTADALPAVPHPQTEQSCLTTMTPVIIYTK